MIPHLEGTAGPVPPPPASRQLGAAPAIPAPRRRRSPGRRALFGLGAASLLALTHGTGVSWAPFAVRSDEPAAAAPAEVALEHERERLLRRRMRLTPPGPWVAIDQTHNRLRLMRGERLVLEAPCSAGSGMVLRDGSSGRTWVFDTPRGRFHVRARIADPVWRKPDWAFLEEGLPIPADASARMTYGVLGDYAFDLGDGYLVHGTLYERLIGRPVSHGCIRVGRAALSELWRSVPVGSPVFIY